jgi:hypothetical protein
MLDKDLRNNLKTFSGLAIDRFWGSVVHWGMETRQTTRTCKQCGKAPHTVGTEYAADDTGSRRVWVCGCCGKTKPMNGARGAWKTWEQQDAGRLAADEELERLMAYISDQQERSGK